MSKPSGHVDLNREPTRDEQIKIDWVINFEAKMADIYMTKRVKPEKISDAQKSLQEIHDTYMKDRYIQAKVYNRFIRDYEGIKGRIQGLELDQDKKDTLLIHAQRRLQDFKKGQSELQKKLAAEALQGKIEEAAIIKQKKPLPISEIKMDRSKFNAFKDSLSDMLTEIEKKGITNFSIMSANLKEKLIFAKTPQKVHDELVTFIDGLNKTYIRDVEVSVETILQKVRDIYNTNRIDFAVTDFLKKPTPPVAPSAPPRPVTPPPQSAPQAPPKFSPKNAATQPPKGAQAGRQLPPKYVPPPTRPASTPLPEVRKPDVNVNKFRESIEVALNGVIAQLREPSHEDSERSDLSIPLHRQVIGLLLNLIKNELPFVRSVKEINKKFEELAKNPVFGEMDVSEPPKGTREYKKKKQKYEFDAALKDKQMIIDALRPVYEKYNVQFGKPEVLTQPHRPPAIATEKRNHAKEQQSVKERGEALLKQVPGLGKPKT